MTEELYKKYRPTKFEDVVGQPQAVAVLSEMVKNQRVPHAILFSGPSGTGKTTLARILCDELGCSPRNFQEINASDERGIDDIRSIRKAMTMSGWGGGIKVYLLDEVHSLTPQAQEALLKPSEDTPQHVYFMLCTTEPEKLTKTLRGRCTHVKLAELSRDDLKEVVFKVSEKAGVRLIGTELHDALVDAADGSAREALVILNAISGLPEGEQLAAITRADTRRQSRSVAQILLKPGSKWKDIVPVLQEVPRDPEKVRQGVLAYMTKVLYGGGVQASKAKVIIRAFEDNWFYSGKAALVAACHDLLCGD